MPAASARDVVEAAPSRQSTGGPGGAQRRLPVLITIPISHYCEKARWALDRAGLAYREQRHVQGIHRVAARRAGAGNTVPVLVTDSEVLGESEQILAWADRQVPEQQRLFASAAADRAAELSLCRRLDERFGPSGRRLIYVHMLRQRRLALEFNNQGVPRWEAHVVRWGWPAITRFIARVLEITPGIEALDEAAVIGELDHAAALLSDGRPYLCGERFGAADLTFAALAAPLIVPPQYGVTLPQPEAMAPETAAMVGRFRAHPAGRFALQLFARHRAPATQPI